MSGSQPLAVRETVWAKIPDQPWWPAKINQVFQENHQWLYKVSFFADHSFTYLYQQQLLPFSKFNQALNATYSTSALYEKAKKMALKAVKREQDCVRMAEEAMRQVLGQVIESEWKMEENITQNLVLIEEKGGQMQILAPSPEVKASQFFNSVQLEAISTSNVIQVLEHYRPLQKKTTYCYEQRKETIRYQDKLKEELLRKYNLLQLPSNHKPHQITDKHISCKKQKIIKKHKNHFKKTSVCNIQILKPACIRKAYQLLKQSGVSDAKTNAVEIVNRLILLSQGNVLKLNSLFMTFARTVGEEKTNQVCWFMGYLEGLEGEKHNEEGSKVTQMDEITV